MGRIFFDGSSIYLIIGLHVSKTIFALWFYVYFFMILYLYIGVGQELTTIEAKVLMSTESPYHLGYLLHFFNLWFYTHFFMILYTYIAPGQGQTTPWGQNFDVNRKALSVCLFVASLKKSLWNLISFIFFNASIHVYSPGTRADNPFGDKILISTETFYFSGHLL